MAAHAVIGQLIAVLIHVAACAGRFQTQKCAVTVYVRVCCDRTFYERRFMARAAVLPRVRATEFESGLLVSELIAPALPVNEFIIPAVMFGVAFTAITIVHFKARVIAKFRVHARAQRVMTNQTILVGHFLAQFMTSRAIGKAFQLRMISGQLAGGYLRPGHGEGKIQEQKTQCRLPSN